VTRPRRRPAAALLLAAAATLLLAACRDGDGPPDPDPSATAAAPDASDPTPFGGAPPRPAAEPGVGEYLAGLPATVQVPDGDPAAVVVLVPGGGWTTADPTGLAPLAQHLLAAGNAVVTITYGTSSTGASWPVPADDVRCAVAFAGEQVPDAPVVLVGHSAGAHLAAVVGLAPDGEGFCPYAPRSADAVVGLAGPYDVSATRGLAGNLFGVAEPEAVDLWAEGNPLLLAGGRADVPFLLVHGSEDGVVPEPFARAFEGTLAAAGHPVDLVVVEGADHGGVVLPDLVGDLLTRWVVEAVVDA
jgi:acetyl esterase/lipase